MTERWEPTPVPLGDGRHDIGDETRAAIFHRLHNDFTMAAPWMTAEQRKHLAMLAAASVRALLHELGALQDGMEPAPVYIPERDGRRCVEHPNGDHELACVTCLEASWAEREAAIRQEMQPPPQTVASPPRPCTCEPNYGFTCRNCEVEKILKEHGAVASPQTPETPAEGQ